jgi:pyrroline-5-carboxylate reductase
MESMMNATVGIVGGGGWLGGAIAECGLSAGVLSASRLIVSSRSARGDRYARWPAVTWTSDNAELARRSQIVILSVRPQQFGALSLDLEGKLVISVMAGVAMATLERRLNAERVVRTMPNAAAEIGRSYTPWVASERATSTDRAFVTALFSSCGEQDEVQTERQLDYLTGLSGSGPAFPALLAKAMLQHAQESGIPEHVATKAVRGVICGATPLMDSDAFNPAETVETFIEYRGTTAAGLSAMIEAGLPQAVGSGLSAADAAAANMAAGNDV